MSRPTSYSVADYGNMIQSTNRMDPYEAALRQAIKPGAVVVDIGAATGIFSLLACQMGAGKVHAIEPDSSIDVARQSAIDNGFGDRVHCHRAISTKVAIDEPADVIVSDIRGPLPLLQHHIPTIRDARARLLKPGGILIPRCDHLWAALIEMPDYALEMKLPWLSNKYGLDLSAGYGSVANTWGRVTAEPHHLMSAPEHWHTIDYRTVEDTDLQHDFAITPCRPGSATGLLLWFETELGDGIGFSNAPTAARQIYGQAIFPFEHPLELTTDSRVDIHIEARLMDDEYVWVWNSTLHTCTDDESPAVRYRQTTANQIPLTLDDIKRRASTFVPEAAPDVAIDALCLSLADGKRALGEIAGAVRDAHPDRFPREQDALSHVADLLDRYHRKRLYE